MEELRIHWERLSFVVVVDRVSIFDAVEERSPPQNFDLQWLLRYSVA